MLNNPIIHKEVLSALRTKKAILMQVLFLLVSVGLVTLLWPAGGLQDIGGEKAMQILSILTIGELVMIIMFAPAFTAASLTSEVEHNTIESLFTTTLKPWEIAIGKIVGSLTFLILLVISGIPALALPFLLGGVSGEKVVSVIGVLLLTAVFVGMIGLLVSTFMHRSYRAIITTYVILLGVCFVAALPAWPFGASGSMLRRGGEVWQKIIHMIVSLSPLEAVLSLVLPKSEYVIGASNFPSFWATFCIVAAVLTVAMGFLVLYRLRRPFAPPRPREEAKVIERGQITTKTVVWHMWFFDPRRRRKNIAWWQNPVLMKEFRTRPMLQTRWLIRAISISLIASVLLMFLVNISYTVLITSQTGSAPTVMASAVAALTVVLIVLVGPAIASGTICSDRETGVWDLLRSTPMSSWRIVCGKFEASIIPLLLLLIATLPALLILLFFNVHLWVNIIRICAVMGMTVMFVSTAGTFFSSVFSRTAASTAATYALVVSLTLLTLLVLLSGGLFREQDIRLVFMVNPVIAAMDAAGNESIQKYSLFIPHLKIMGIATCVLFAATVVRVFQLRRAA